MCIVCHVSRFLLFLNDLEAIFTIDLHTVLLRFFIIVILIYANMIQFSKETVPKGGFAYIPFRPKNIVFLASFRRFWVFFGRFLWT